MAFVAPKDRVLEHSTSNSQSVFAVTGALDPSYNAFSASMSIGDTTIGAVVEPGVAFKSGVLTYSNTNEITVSTAFDSKGTFSASGVKELFMGLPAAAAQAVGNVGFVNKFRNGTMDVWQRGFGAMSVSTSGGYTADGWIATPSGGSVTAEAAFSLNLAYRALKLTGGSGVTGLTVKQRIEGVIAAPLWSRQVTVQARVFNNTGASITPKLTVKTPTAMDNYAATTTDVNAVSLQSCPNNAWTVVAYTFTANASAYEGQEVTFDLGNNFSADTKWIQLSELDIRETPGVPSGLNGAPPVPEMRPLPIEMHICQRYFDTSYANGTAPGASISSGFAGLGLQAGAFSFLSVSTQFHVDMRVTPSLTVYDDAGAASKISYYNGSWNNGGTALIGSILSGSAVIGVNNIANAQGISFMYAASAEL